MRHAAILVSILLLGGCGRILGLEQDYVLREPIQVRLVDSRERVTLPPGTRVKQVGFKDGVAFVEIPGEASLKQLQAAGEPK